MEEQFVAVELVSKCLTEKQVAVGTGDLRPDQEEGLFIQTTVVMSAVIEDTMLETVIDIKEIDAGICSIQFCVAYFCS